MPIWLSPKIDWDYNVKMEPINEEIHDPRNLEDLRVHLVGTHVFAFFAYAHLLSTVSQSRGYLRGQHPLAAVGPDTEQSKPPRKQVLFLAGNASCTDLRGVGFPCSDRG